MKKVICICISLIMLFSFASTAFADEIQYLDPVSGEALDESDSLSGIIKLTNICKYDISKKMYIYTTGITSSTDVECSVYNGMITTDSVVVKASDSAKIEVFRSGQLVDPSEYENLMTAGSYVINNTIDSSELFTFTIVPRVTNAVSSYKVPAIFYITTATYNGQPMYPTANTVKFENDGAYYIEYVGNNSGVSYTLNINVDRTYPELEIVGVDEDGIARGPVTFNSMEEGSTVEVTVDGNVVEPVNDQYTKAGQYTVKYTDKAGNVSSYYFKMHVFFDVSAYMFIGIVIVVLACAFLFIIYNRRHRKIR